ncbi:hypothetical protein pVco14_066 [Vibrio phage pVco-14]|nr:hypothetical protein pVco14_066 [Vibrio phage pVco-14]
MIKQLLQVIWMLREDFAAIFFEVTLFAAIIMFAFRGMPYWPF